VRVLEKRMFKGFKEFYILFKEVKKNNTVKNMGRLQKEWMKLYWTEKEDNYFRDWAVKYLQNKGVVERLARREVGWFMLKYAPKIKEKRG